MAATLLRYYWFRISDVMVPLGAALVVGAISHRWQATQPKWHGVGLVAALLVVGFQLGETMWRRQLDPCPPADARHRQRCRLARGVPWAATETPPDAVFLTPRLCADFSLVCRSRRGRQPQRHSAGCTEHRRVAPPQRADSRHAER